MTEVRGQMPDNRNQVIRRHAQSMNLEIKAEDSDWSSVFCPLSADP